MPSPAMVVALIALVLSTTGLADAARHAVISAIDGHPISTKPHAGGILLLGKNRKFPASVIPTVKERQQGWLAKPRRSWKGPARPTASASAGAGSWCMETAPYPLTNADVGKNNFIWASKACEEAGGWLPSASELLGAAAVDQARVHDPRLAADRHDQPGSHTGPERRTRDELDARHDRSGFGGRRVRGCQRRGYGRPSPGPGQPDPAARQPAARIAAVRDRLRQRSTRAASPAPSRSSTPRTSAAPSTRRPAR